MANLSKAYFFDAGKNPPRTRVIEIAGERRLEKIPNGRVERWVNSHGAVVFVQMLQPGEIPRQEAVDRRRNERRRARPAGREHQLKLPHETGWIEWSRCPLTQGTMPAHAFPRALQSPCSQDFKPTGNTACPHVEHVIKDRLKTYQAEQDIKLAGVKARADAERRAQEAQLQLNANIARIVEAALPNLTGDPPTPKGKRDDK